MKKNFSFLLCSIVFILITFAPFCRAEQINIEAESNGTVYGGYRINAPTYSNGKYVELQKAGDYWEFREKIASAILFFGKTTQGGLAEIKVDGKFYSYFDTFDNNKLTSQYLSVRQQKTLPFGLDGAVHTVRITNTGIASNTGVSSPRIIVDNMVVETDPETATSYDAGTSIGTGTGSGAQYILTKKQLEFESSGNRQGGVIKSSPGIYSAGSAFILDNASDYWSYTGNIINLNAYVGKSNKGTIFDVYVDNTLVDSFDTFNADYDADNPLIERMTIVKGLADGTHSVRIQHGGELNSYGQSEVILDYGEISYYEKIGGSAPVTPATQTPQTTLPADQLVIGNAGTLVGNTIVLEPESDGIQMGGSVARSPSFSKGAALILDNDSDYWEYFSKMGSVQITYARASEGASFDVYVDGSLKKTIDTFTQYSNTASLDPFLGRLETITAVENLDGGVHSIRVKNSGKKNAMGGNKVYIDRVEIGTIAGISPSQTKTTLVEAESEGVFASGNNPFLYYCVNRDDKSTPTAGSKISLPWLSKGAGLSLISEADKWTYTGNFSSVNALVGISLNGLVLNFEIDGKLAYSFDTNTTKIEEANKQKKILIATNLDPTKSHTIRVYPTAKANIAKAYSYTEKYSEPVCKDVVKQECQMQYTCNDAGTSCSDKNVCTPYTDSVCTDVQKTRTATSYGPERTCKSAGILDAIEIDQTNAPITQIAATQTIVPIKILPAGYNSVLVEPEEEGARYGGTVDTTYGAALRLAPGEYWEYKGNIVSAAAIVNKYGYYYNYPQSFDVYIDNKFYKNYSVKGFSGFQPDLNQETALFDNLDGKLHTIKIKNSGTYTCNVGKSLAASDVCFVEIDALKLGIVGDKIPQPAADLKAQATAIAAQSAALQKIQTAPTEPTTAKIIEAETDGLLKSSIIGSNVKPAVIAQDPNFSGGKALLFTSTAGWLEITTPMYSANAIVPKMVRGGTFNVYLDGNKTGSFSNDSGGANMTFYNSKIPIASNLDGKTHKLMIQFAGPANAMAYLDAIEIQMPESAAKEMAAQTASAIPEISKQSTGVAASPQQIPNAITGPVSKRIIEAEADPAFLKGSLWYPNYLPGRIISNAGYSGGKALAFTNGIGSWEITAPMYSVSAIVPLLSTGGKANVYIDNKLVKTIDTTSPGDHPVFFGEKILLADGLDGKNHKLVIQAVAPVSGLTVILDAVEITEPASQVLGAFTAAPKLEILAEMQAQAERLYKLIRMIQYDVLP